MDKKSWRMSFRHRWRIGPNFWSKLAKRINFRKVLKNQGKVPQSISQMNYTISWSVTWILKRIWGEMTPGRPEKRTKQKCDPNGLEMDNKSWRMSFLHRWRIGPNFWSKLAKRINFRKVLKKQRKVPPTKNAEHFSFWHFDVKTNSNGLLIDNDKSLDS